MSLPKISIITVNYNQPQVTLDFLQSLTLLTYTNIEVFVVDNASSVDSSVIKQQYPDIHYLESKVNLGFAGGNNLAIKQATGDYILLINNDTEVTPNFLQPMVECFTTYADAGIVSSKIIFYHTDNLLQYAGTGNINKYSGRGHTIGYKEKDNGQYDKIYTTELCHGACMMFSREVLNKVGLLAEEYFLYYEEYDYCERVKLAGYKIYYCGLSKIYHKESATVGKLSPLKTFYMTRNRLVFIRKFFKGGQLLLAGMFFYVLAVPKNFIMYLLKGHTANAMAMLKALSGKARY